ARAIQGWVNISSLCRSAHRRQFCRNQIPEFEPHSLKDPNQIAYIDRCYAKPEEDNIELDHRHVVKEKHLVAKYGSAQIKSVGVGTQNDALERHADSSEIGIHLKQVGPEDLTALGTELRSHFACVSGL